MRRLSERSIAKLYRKGMSIWSIANRLHCSGVGVWKVLIRLKIKIRPIGTFKPWGRKKRGFQYYCNRDKRWYVRPVGGGRKRRAVYRMEKKLGHKIPKGYHVHHKDEDTTNDRLSNLQVKKAGQHVREHNLGKKNPSKGRKGEAHHLAKLTLSRIELVKTLHGRGVSQLEIGKKLGVHQTTVSHVLTGRSWQY